MTSTSTETQVRILCLKFILEKGSEDDRDYILNMVKDGLDSHAYATTKRIHGGDVQTGVGVYTAMYRIVITYTHHFKTRHDRRAKKIFFKLKLKYPEIKMSA